LAPDVEDQFHWITVQTGVMKEKDWAARGGLTASFGRGSWGVG